jgi:hypothetical protein
MSRRNNVTEPAYGQIKLKCPRGHEVGAILVQPRRPIGGRKALYRLGAVLKAPEIEELESPEENFVHEGRMEWGDSRCRLRDLRAPLLDILGDGRTGDRQTRGHASRDARAR